jgi:dTDP-4-dehydrorhamnose 3,5-epimerase
MTFNEADIPGVFTIGLDRMADERGWFARAWCASEFRAHGLAAPPVQCNISYSRRRGTLRGMHYQVPPHAEDKLVRVTHGAIYDVAVDLREESPTYRRWRGFELTRGNAMMLFVPKGIAHGFLTLTDDAEVFYLVTASYTREAERGVRWNDPAFGIEWPIEPVVISERDRSHPDFEA